jgi:hypothetical protein
VQCLLRVTGQSASNAMVDLCRRPSEPHQLHFDVDELRLRCGLGDYTLRHPVRMGNQCLVLPRVVEITARTSIIEQEMFIL